jgi:sugar/nucleoside kinase (ribokinase family)
VLSSADIAGDHALADYYAHHCRLVVLTHGAEGATLYIRGVPQHIPPHPATEVDPTGAGDVFAAAMLVRLYETGNPVVAAHFASVVAAAAVEGPGVQHIPSRAEVLRRMP